MQSKMVDGSPVTSVLTMFMNKVFCFCRESACAFYVIIRDELRGKTYEKVTINTLTTRCVIWQCVTAAL